MESLTAGRDAVLPSRRCATNDVLARTATEVFVTDELVELESASRQLADSVRRLIDAGEPLDRFLAETAALGAKRGPLLVQLPPSLAFDAGIASSFFAGLRRRYDEGHDG